MPDVRHHTVTITMAATKEIHVINANAIGSLDVNANANSKMRSLLLACEEIDVAIQQRRASQHHTMRKDCRSCDRAGSVVKKKAGVWFNAVEQSAIDIEDVDVVTFRTAIRISAIC